MTERKTRSRRAPLPVPPCVDGPRLVRLAAPEGASCSFAGQEIERRPDGSVLVPQATAQALAAHGFKPIQPEPEE